MKIPLPTKQQLDFLDWEIGVFFHYGIRTFNETNRDWDMKPMSPETFNPSENDCRSWVRQMKEIGVGYTVLTSKHHDGFALWPTAQTEFCIRNSSYKNGNGDIIEEYVNACREYDMKCGIYYSCAQFDTKDMKNSYDDMVIGQLTELLSNYGKIDYLWFDSCGSENHEFDVERIVKTIRSLQPEIIIFGGWDGNVRWIGNEWGLAPVSNSNYVADKQNPEQSVNFYPGECDCCITRNDWENFWFYNDTHKDCVRTPEEMVGLYYHTVGRGTNLLINIAPDRRGLLPEENVKLLADMVKEINRRFIDCRPKAESFVKEGDSYVITFPTCVLIDTLVIEEDMTNGEHVEAFSVNITQTSNLKSAINVYNAFTIGHRHICTFPPVRAKRVVLKIVKANGKETIKNMFASYVSSDRQIVQI